MAKRIEDHGITRLHLVDLDGAREKHVVSYRTLENIANRTNLIIDFGGGLRDDSDVRIAFDSGADMITGGSIAVKDRNTFIDWLETYGPDKILLGADFKDRKIAISGWEEQTDMDLMNFLSNFLEEGIKTAICTDVSRDGMLEGPSIDIYREIKKKLPELVLIASGGISEMNDILMLEEMGIKGVIIGKAIYEGKIDLKDIEKYIIENL